MNVAFSGRQEINNILFNNDYRRLSAFACMRTLVGWFESEPDSSALHMLPTFNNQTREMLDMSRRRNNSVRTMVFNIADSGTTNSKQTDEAPKVQHNYKLSLRLLSTFTQKSRTCSRN